MPKRSIELITNEEFEKKLSNYEIDDEFLKYIQEVHKYLYGLKQREKVNNHKKYLKKRGLIPETPFD